MSDYCRIDGGRLADGYTNEHNDCTVRAYAVAAGIPYKQAHFELWQAGRKMRRGFRVVKFYDSKGWQKFPRPSMTVENYIRYIAHSGNWIIRIRRHVFAVIDGVIYDEMPEATMKCHVLNAWKVK